MAGLVKRIDKAVAENQDKKLAAVVNIVGKPDEMSDSVAEFAEKHGVENVALTVSDQKNAEKFKVNPEAKVTVMHYKGKKVKSNHAVPPGGLNDAAIEEIVAGINTILE